MARAQDRIGLDADDTAQACSMSRRRMLPVICSPAPIKTGGAASCRPPTDDALSGEVRFTEH
ncbi:hypothetical protein [Roseobacter cerasinus]|uniref:hypothetical protein n=1 Tax=Roseobacter cerasinus TaxID=2602289 RepID=UPI001358B466|nr:hypothetical protein [Roseobacter cerasinus]